MEIQDILLLFTVLLNFIFGFFIFYKSIKNKINAGVIFSFVAFSSGFWALISLIVMNVSDYEKAYIFAKLAFVSAVIIAFIFLLFNLKFTKRFRDLNIFVKILFIVSPIAISAICISDLLIIDVKIYSWGADPSYGLGYYFFVLYFLFFMIFSFYVLISQYTKSQGIEKSQLLYFLIGTLASIVIGIFANIIYPAITGYSYLSKIGPVGSIIMVSFISYAILRYRLMDIRIVIKKSIIYFLTIGSLILVAILLTIFLQKTFEQYFGVQPAITIAVLMVLLIMILPKLRDHIKQKFDNIFLKDYIDFSEKIDNLEKNIKFSTQLTDLTKEVSISLKDMLKVSQVEFYTIDRKSDKFICQFPQKQEKRLARTGLLPKILDSKREIIIKEELNYFKPENREEKKEVKYLIKELEKLNSAVAISIFSGNEFIGIILIGSKINKGNFSTEDLDLITQVADKIGDILANIILYTEAIQRAKMSF